MWSGLKTNRAALLILNAVRVRITPQPALAGLGGCHHRMPGALPVRRSVFVG